MSSKHIKVAILAPLPPPTGGIGTWALRVEKSMPALCCDVALVDEGLIGGREFFGERAKKNLYDEWQRCRRIWHDLEVALESESVDVVHSNIPSVAGGMLRELFCCRIAHRHGVPFVIHYRCTVSSSVKGAILEFLLRMLSNHADAVIVLNEKSRAFVEARTRTQVTLIPNFANVSEIASDCSPSGPVKRCLYVGGVCKEKGIFDLFEVAQRFPNVEFKAIGKVEAGVAEVAPANVVLTGPLPHEEITSALHEADVFFFLSHYVHEGFANALCEAMAAGLPCIVTDWAANADMIGDKGGFVVQPGDIDACEESLRALDNPTLRRYQGKRNIAKVEEEYSEDVVLRQYIELYNRLVGDYER